MRNCVLSIMSSIVHKVLSGEELDPKSRNLRDQCLDHLEDHIHDVHAFVRSKVRSFFIINFKYLKNFFFALSKRIN